MEPDEITWKLVSNTVASRMIDLSLVHKLLPSRRLRRRNKAMNVAMKQFHGLKSYSQYVKLKTSALRNLSDDSETDDNMSFTEDDYSILYKSDLSLTNYLAEMSSKNKNYSYEIALDTYEDDITSDVNDERVFVQKSKSKSSGTMSSDCQKDLRKKSKKKKCTSPSTKRVRINSFTYNNAVNSQRGNIQSDMTTDLNIPNKDEFVQDNVKKNTSSIESKVITNNDSYINVKTMKLYDETSNINKTKYYESTNNSSNNNGSSSSSNNNSNEFVQPNSLKYEVSKGIGPNDSSKLEAQEGSDNINQIQNADDSCTIVKNSLGQNHSNGSEQHAVTKNLCIGKIKSDKHQPKDSGIEEDTEEELPAHGKKHYKKLKNKTENTDENASIPTSILNCNSSFRNLDNNSKSERYYSSSKSDSEDTTIPVNKIVNINKEEHKEMVQKHKAQPKVTHTEIVNKKYKIICHSSVFNKHANSKVLDMTEEAEQNGGDNVSPWTERRLQQLRRLNLTVDSDSSLSENDDLYCNIENMRDKLFKRSMESSGTSDNEDRSSSFKYQVPIQFDKELEKNDKKKRNIKNLKRTTDCLDEEYDASKHRSEIKVNSLSDTKQSSSISNQSPQFELSHSNCLTSRNAEKEENTKECSKESMEIEITMQAANEGLVIRSRPHNLQDLIQEESLVAETTTPSFTFKDIDEDELFIIDIPTAVLDTQLTGCKIILTEKRLKIGEQKYRVEYKDTDNMSCVFASGKFHKPYKIVKIKPATRIVTREKIT